MFWKSKRITELERKTRELGYAVNKLQRGLEANKENLKDNNEMYMKHTNVLTYACPISVRTAIYMILNHLNLELRTEPEKKFLAVIEPPKKGKK